MTPRQSRAGRQSRVWLAIALASLIGLVLLSVAVARNVGIPFDQALLTMALGLSAWRGLWDAISAIGNYPMIPIAIAFVLWLIVIKRRREAVLVTVLLVVATVGSEALKAVVARPRPLGSAPGIPGVIYSYPSGHSFEDLIILGMLALRLWRSRRPLWLRGLVVVLVVAEVTLVSIARVALDLHFPSDVLAGLFSGLVVLGLYAWFTRPGGWADRPPRRSS